MSKAIEQIRTLDNVLFHGSPDYGITVMEPRKGTDSDESNVFNNDTAIFASDNISFAIIFALVNTTKIGNQIGSFDWSVNTVRRSDGTETVSHIPLQAREIIENSKGCLYLLPKDSFHEANSPQFKSKEPVSVLDSIEVTLQDYCSTGGKIEWTDRKSP